MLFTDLLTHLRQEISGQRAWDLVAEITRHHRIQASPGFREAASALTPRLEAAGLQVASLRPGEALDFLRFRRDHKKQAGLLEPQLLYWSDGHRTLAEVEHLMELETGVRDSAYARRYLQLLARAGLLELRVTS